MKEYQLCALFGNVVLDYGERILEEDKRALQKKYKGLYFYHIEGEEDKKSRWVNVDNNCVINYSTTIISQKPLPQPCKITPDDYGQISKKATIQKYATTMYILDGKDYFTQAELDAIAKKERPLNEILTLM